MESAHSFLPSTAFSEKHSRFISINIVFEHPYRIFIKDKRFVKPDKKRLTLFVFISCTAALVLRLAGFVRQSPWPCKEYMAG
jgi:hypothetical protein